MRMQISKKLTLGEKLREVRKMNNFTQDFVAEQLNICRSTYTYYETGKTEPSLKSLSILAKLYGVSLEEFLPEEKSTSINDSNSQIIGYTQKQVGSSITTAMGTLSQDERELVALYRLASAKGKRKITLELEKNKNK